MKRALIALVSLACLAGAARGQGAGPLMAVLMGERVAAAGVTEPYDYPVDPEEAAAVLTPTYPGSPEDDTSRYMPFTYTWTQDFETNFHYTVAAGDWKGSGIYTLTTAGYRPIGGEGRVYLLKSILGAFIQSPPLVGGVGTIYYTARNRVPNQILEIHVQVTTSEIPTAGDWSTVKILNFPKQSERINIAEPVLLNRTDVKGVRFIVTEESPYDSTPARTDGAVALDNIVISYPPTVLQLEEVYRVPASPTSSQHSQVSVTIENLTTNAVATNVVVSVVYQHTTSVGDSLDAEAWLQAAMTRRESGNYVGVIPEQPKGFVHYYYVCTFGGYFYGRDPDGPTVTSGGIDYGTEPFYSDNTSPTYLSNGVVTNEVPTVYSVYRVR